MSIYKYTAINSQNKKIEGQKNVQSRDELVDYLLSQGLTVISVREDLGAGLQNLLQLEIGGISLTEKVLIAKQLATMISAGIPIIQAIDILREQSEKSNVKNKLSQVYKKIEAGSSLSAAFKEVGGLLSEVQINLIEAGEKSGNLNEMLIKVSEDMEKSKSLRGKVLGAMIYPALIFFVLIAVVFVMVVFMVPQVESLYKSFGDAELPGVTLFLVSLSKQISNPVFLLIVLFLIIAGFLSYKNYTSRKGGRLVVDRLKLRIPIFGNLMAKIQLVQFCRLISMLSKSGVPIIDAIEIVSRAMSNSVYSEILQNAKQEVTRGNALSIGIAKNNIADAFPKILIKIIATGEDAGKLDQVLFDMYKYYDAEVEQITSNLTKLMEPFILILVGGLVAFLAVAIYLPIYNVANITGTGL